MHRISNGYLVSYHEQEQYIFKMTQIIAQLVNLFCAAMSRVDVFGLHVKNIGTCHSHIGQQNTLASTLVLLEICHCLNHASHF